jgi:hypothetical protein
MRADRWIGTGASGAVDRKVSRASDGKASGADLAGKAKAAGEAAGMWLEVNSSDQDTGAVLSQQGTDGKWGPVTFYSKSLNDVQ